MKHSRTISCIRCIFHLGPGGKPQKLRVWGSQSAIERQASAAGWGISVRYDGEHWVCPKHAQEQRGDA